MSTSWRTRMSTYPQLFSDERLLEVAKNWDDDGADGETIHALTREVIRLRGELAERSTPEWWIAPMYGEAEGLPAIFAAKDLDGAFLKARVASPTATGWRCLGAVDPADRERRLDQDKGVMEIVSPPFRPTTVDPPEPRLIDLLATLDERNWLTEVDHPDDHIALEQGRFVHFRFQRGRISGLWSLADNELDGEDFMSTRWRSGPLEPAAMQQLEVWPDLDVSAQCQCGTLCCDACWAKEAAENPCPTPGCEQPQYHGNRCGVLRDRWGVLNNCQCVRRWGVVEYTGRLKPREIKP